MLSALLAIPVASPREPIALQQRDDHGGNFRELPWRGWFSIVCEGLWVVYRWCGHGRSVCHGTSEGSDGSVQGLALARRDAHSPLLVIARLFGLCGLRNLRRGRGTIRRDRFETGPWSAARAVPPIDSRYALVRFGPSNQKREGIRPPVSN